jgi:hypothetical protein
MIVDPDTVNEEVVEVTNRSGTTLTVTRGVDGTTAVAHSAGAVIRHGVSARDFDEPNAFLNAGGTVGGNTTITGTIGATGLAGSLLSSATPAALGTAAQGTSAIPSRQDHVHSGTNVALTTPTITGGTASAQVVIGPEERCTVSATAATGTINFDLATQGVLYYTTNASANFTLNFRGNSGTTLNSALAVGDSISAVFLNTNGTTAYYPTVFQIDTTAVTPRWSGGSAPASGNASSIDAYSFTIIKTAATPTYVVLASAGRYA